MKIVETEASNLTCPLRKNDLTGVWESCLGQRCMAWRWNGLVPYRGKGDLVLGSKCGAKPEDAMTQYEPRKGWCGLAGYPR